MQTIKYSQWPSVNALTQPLIDDLMRNADLLRLDIQTLSNGATIIDGGVNILGGLEAGRRIAEICMGGLGSVSLQMGAGRWPMAVNVHAANPVLACMGSQYAGWSLTHGEGEKSFRALASGPGRALAGKEKLLDRNEIGIACRFQKHDQIGRAHV